MRQATAKKLAGLRTFVVEDDPLIALDVALSLQDAGAEVYGPYPTCAAALAAIETLSENIELSVAILDVELGRETSEPIARELVDRGIPFIFHTGNDWRGRCAYDGIDAPVIQKPSTTAMLINGVIDCCGAPAAQSA